MKVLVLAHRVPYPPNKGEKLRTFHQIEHLVKQGTTVSVLAPIENADDRQNAKSLETKLGIEVITGSLPTKLWRYARALLTGKAVSVSNFYSQALFSLFKQTANKSDAILCTASSMAEYILQLPAPPSAKLLMDFMDVDSDKWRQYANSSRWPLSWLYNREHHKIQQLEKVVIQQFEQAFLIAEAEVNLFNKCTQPTEKLSVLGNGMDADVFCPAPEVETEPSAQHFLFVGVMDYKPNVDAVLWFINECWSRIRTQHPNATFTIAGMNPTKAIEAFHGTQNITVTGFVDDIVPCFQSATVFVAPFRLARGVQNKVLQAMSCGLPVVTTPMGAEGIIHQANESLIIADNADAFVDECLSLTLSAEKRVKVGRAARDIIEQHYAWPSVLEPLFKALNVEDKA